MNNFKGDAGKFKCPYCGLLDCRTDVELKEHMKSSEHMRKMYAAVCARIKAIKLELQQLESWVETSECEQ